MVTRAPNEAMDGSGGLEITNVPQMLDECLVAAVISVDAQQKVIAFNSHAAHLVRLPSDQILGHPADRLPAPLRDLLTRCSTTGEPGMDHQVLLPGTADDPILARVCTTPVYSGPGLPCGVIAVLNNVTPARHLDRNLRRMDRLASIGTLSASMAHEVKNAMVAVKIFVELLIKDNRESPLAGIVESEMRRIDSIVSQMLRFSGPTRAALAPLHLHSILEESLSLVQHHLEGRKIRLVRAFGASSDAVRGDAYQLEQAVLNLLFNALDAMGADGELTVATELVTATAAGRPEEELLQLTVKDTGMGIAPENLPRLFEPFFTTKSEGTGLGLPITRRIVEEHRGVIRVDSKPHRGTTFTIELPIRENPAMHVGMQRLDAPLQHLRKARQLVNGDNRQSCVLERLGRPASRDQLHPTRRQRLRQLDDSGLVGDGEQRPFNLDVFHGKYCTASKPP